MRVLKLSMQLAVFFMLFIFLACASTNSTSIWKDKTYQGHPEKILVINAFPNPGSRRLFEDEFVKAVKERGVDAVVSYSIMPDPIVSDKDSVADEEALYCCIRDVGADTVLINKPVGKPRGELRGEIVAVYLDMQTNVYDIKSNRLILSIQEKMRIKHSTPSSALIAPIKSYVEDLVNNLSKAGILSKR